MTHLTTSHLGHEQPPTRDLSGRGALRFAFYGWVPPRTIGGAQVARDRQLASANNTIRRSAGIIIAEYFDDQVSGSVLWPDRPRAAALLEAVADPERGFDAVVVGHLSRGMFAGEFGQILSWFREYEVPLWLPGLRGPIRLEDLVQGLVSRVLEADPVRHRPLGDQDQGR